MKTIKLSDFNIFPIENSAKHENISDAEYFSNYGSFISASKLHRISPRRNGSMDKFYNPEPIGWNESLSNGM